jgi:tRNA(adenine34) deaminase
MNDNIYNELIKLSEKSLKYNDVPVGAVIVKNNKIIAKGFNTREKNNKIINHAEINAICKANKKLKSYFLYDCDLYVTLKPCTMCLNIINSARIKNVYYLIDKPENKKEYSKVNYSLLNNEYSEKYRKLLTNFFDKLRK